MEASSPNPVYARLMRGRRWPSARAASWIGAGVGAAVGLGAALITTNLAVPLSWSIRLGIGPLCVVIGLTGCFVLSAGFMAGYIRAGDFPLLRLSRLGAGTIVDGYTDGIRYRLRALRAIVVWSLSGWTASLLVRLPPELSGWTMCGVVFGLAVLAVGVGFIVAGSMAELLVQAGVWFALRAGHHAGLLAAGIGALAGSAFAVMVGAAFVPGLFRCCAPLVAVAAVVMLESRGAFFRADSIRMVEAKGWPGVQSEASE